MKYTFTSPVSLYFFNTEKFKIAYVAHVTCLLKSSTCTAFSITKRRPVRQMCLFLHGHHTTQSNFYKRFGRSWEGIMAKEYGSDYPLSVGQLKFLRGWRKYQSFIRAQLQYLWWDMQITVKAQYWFGLEQDCICGKPEAK